MMQLATIQVNVIEQSALRTYFIPDILEVRQDGTNGVLVFRDGRPNIRCEETQDTINDAIEAKFNSAVRSIPSYLEISDGVTAPGAGGGVARIYVDTADGDLKVVFADATVKTIVVDT